jgi:hypothetical protein
MKENKRIFIPASLVLLFFILIVGYIAWNSANPQKSCASCHEINPSVESSQSSAHREIECSQCHGTALSNGLHSVIEKTNMLFFHLSTDEEGREIRLDEDQIVEIMDKCENCHRTQYADWKSGGHSANYSHIFLDEVHNKKEQPYWDCLRCHGMFYQGNIYDLMEPVDNRGAWNLKNPDQADIPTIPCLACHQIHAENETRAPAQTLDNPRNIFYEREERNIPYGLYLRADMMFLRADYLPNPDMSKSGKKITTAHDYSYRLCIQCHSPNYAHETGSQDDRTPTGVHEGLSCNACHKVHSNDSKNSCSSCHPGISNCGLDVTKMNTSFLSADSPNNIHFVECKDCHPKKFK